MFRPAGLLATPIAPTAVIPPGSRGFYVRAYHGSLPLRAPDMLTVRFGQLTVRGLSPLKIRSLVGCSPNVLAHRRGAFCRVQVERRVRPKLLDKPVSHFRTFPSTV
jgi:hypothetical protein